MGKFVGDRGKSELKVRVSPDDESEGRREKERKRKCLFLPQIDILPRRSVRMRMREISKELSCEGENPSIFATDLSGEKYSEKDVAAHWRAHFGEYEREGEHWTRRRRRRRSRRIEWNEDEVSKMVLKKVQKTRFSRK